MKKEEYSALLDKYAEDIAQIRYAAHSLHASVNQAYDQVHPYGYHLDMVAHGVRDYGCFVCGSEVDVVPLMFAAYFHDSIEDARQTYNDVVRIARQFMDEQQSLLAAEIVYALTNDKGRTRSERAGDKYYQGIRETPYAPFVKLCDRLANTSYSFRNTDEANAYMKEVYAREMPHFLQAITVESDDPRYLLPTEMVEEILNLVRNS
jgi:(p)ppGpp synthase/HD superfamily hydrolase